VAESGVEPDAPGLGLMVLFFMPTGIIFLLVAFVLGIAGMLQRRRRRLYAVLGTIVSAVVLTIGYLAWLVPVCQDVRDRCNDLQWEPAPEIHYAKEPPEV
jgi:Mn2+/Fe2+ NRAMP family transporter